MKRHTLTLCNKSEHCSAISNMNLQIKLLNSSSARPLFRTTETVWYILTVIQALLFFRFILKLFGANPTGDFTNVIYNITNYILYPLNTILESSTNGVSVFEWTTLLGNHHLLGAGNRNH